jgi:steroid 5-alpha reductase family enzyme
MNNILLTTFSLTLLFFSTIWPMALYKKDLSIVDSFWGLSFLTIAIYHVNLIELGLNYHQLCLFLVIITWSVRLSFYLMLRNSKSGEDKRYTVWKEKTGKSFWWKSLFVIFLSQALLAWIISLSFQWVFYFNTNPSPTWTSVSLFISIFGILYESIADYQLSKFKKDENNKGKTLTTGLWEYSRHPNYFGEIITWWGIFSFTIPTQGGWYTILSPILITILILKVSGVPILEKNMTKKLDSENTKNIPIIIPKIKLF